MKFGNGFWLILFWEYISPKLFAVHAGEVVSLFQGPFRRSSLLVPGTIQEKQSPCSRAHVWDAAPVGSQNNPGHCPASRTTYRTNLFNWACLVLSGVTPAKMGPMYFVFCRLHPSPPKLPRQCLAPTPVISLLLTNTVSWVRDCVSIWLERFRGSQKEDQHQASKYLIPRCPGIRF